MGQKLRVFGSASYLGEKQELQLDARYGEFVSLKLCDSETRGG
jgi:hypothetical protein